MSGALLASAVLCASCSSGPGASSSSSAPPPASAWPTATEATNCATAFPSDWLHCLVKAHPSFSQVPLSYLALPGAENAGTFNLDEQAFVNQAGSACTTIPSAQSLGGAKLQRFSSTQDETITRQLDDGVRWIDLSVGYNGGGSPVAGWRVTQNLYSSWPLFEYLDEVANWAILHPAEPVVVDLSTICYGQHPTTAVEKGLWENFATKSVVGSGPATIANVVANPSSFGGNPATATLSAFARSHHNVVVLIPPSAKDAGVLSQAYHVEAVTVASPGHSAAGTTVVEHSDPRIAPTSFGQFSSANSQLASFPSSAQPSLGSLHGTGLYVSKLAYELQGAPPQSQSAIFTSFVGLIANAGPYAAWMTGLWNGAYGNILTSWATRTNVVLANGVEHGGFLAQMIERNGR